VDERAGKRAPDRACVLRPGPRPYLAIGIPFAIAAAISLSVFMMRGMWPDAVKTAVGVLLVYGAICLALARCRIAVTARGISVRETLGRERSVRFDEIVASVPGALGEPDHPVTLCVYTAAERPGHEAQALRIRLKPYRQEEVRSLLAMPELKVTPSVPRSWR
jgi:hypothetical protein